MHAQNQTKGKKADTDNDTDGVEGVQAHALVGLRIISFNLRELWMDPEGQETRKRGGPQEREPCERGARKGGLPTRGGVPPKRDGWKGAVNKKVETPKGRGGEFRFPPRLPLPLWAVTLSPWVASPPPSSCGNNMTSTPMKSHQHGRKGDHPQGKERRRTSRHQRRKGDHPQQELEGEGV